MGALVLQKMFRLDHWFWKPRIASMPPSRPAARNAESNCSAPGVNPGPPENAANRCKPGA
jgi:hypothetical protein